MRFLSLFAGIGGLDLGLERAGMTCVGQCEIDPFCQRVLAKHWPGVWRHDDVRTLTGAMVEEHCGGRPELICGGFPCQDISNAGRRAGIRGERSGLWSEYLRVICELRGAWAILENVAAILGRGLDSVLGDLAEVGYDAEWHCVPASVVGAPHIRDRIWIVAYPAGSGNGEKLHLPVRQREPRSAAPDPDGCGSDVPDAAIKPTRGEVGSGGNRPAEKEWAQASSPSRGRLGLRSIPDALGPRLERAGLRRAIANHAGWCPEPGVCRVADGVSANVDRLVALGNAVVPQVAEYIGRAIMESQGAPHA